MRRTGLVMVAAGLAATACGHRDGGDGNAVVLKAPVVDPAEIAKFVPPSAPSPTPTPRADAATLLPGAVAPSDALDGSPAAARAVASRYFAAIAARHYDDAWALWSDHGKAAGLSPDAFAAQFADYRSYAGTAGIPRNPGGGAGNRFIEVPVRVESIDRDGRQRRMTGTLTMHRIPVSIDTGDPAAHLWRINTAAIAPATRKPEAAAMPAQAAASYRCEDGFSFRAAFDNVADRVALFDGGRRLVTLAGQQPGSGIWYAAPGWDLRGKGRAADLSRPDAAPTTCRAD